MPGVAGSPEPFTRLMGRHVRLDPAEREALFALPVSLRTLEAGSYLLREGDPPHQCLLLLSGYVFRQKLTGDGSRQITSLHIPGDALDFQNLYLDVADHDIQTLTRVEVAMVPRDAVHAMAADRPRIARAILLHVLIETSITREWVLNIGRRPAIPRLAHLLCEFAARLDARGLADGGGYELPMTQEQLGDALGLTSVHVNRTLKTLEAMGLITRNRRVISFPRIDALRKTADFDARYLHLQQEDS